MMSFVARAGDGGGLACKGGVANLIGCTVVNNAAGVNPDDPTTTPDGGPGSPPPNPDGIGGGIYVKELPSTTVTIRSTIVALNREAQTNFFDPTSSPDIYFFGSGRLVSQGHNLIGIHNSGNGFPNANGDLIGSKASPLDPLLGLLADYGGPTVTYALRPESPARDAGDDTITGTDQRGQPRLAGTHVDIGAFEASTGAVVGFALGSSGAFQQNGTVTITLERTGDTTTAAAVEFSTIDGTATAGADYIAASGTVEFAPGQTERAVQIPFSTIRRLEIGNGPKSSLIHRIRLRSFIVSAATSFTSGTTNPGSSPSPPAAVRFSRTPEVCRLPSFGWAVPWEPRR